MVFFWGGLFFTQAKNKFRSVIFSIPKNIRPSRKPKELEVNIWPVSHNKELTKYGLLIYMKENKMGAKLRKLIVNITQQI